MMKPILMRFCRFSPNCNTPQSLAVSGIRADRATMSWTDAEDITTWNIIVVEGTEVADFSDYTIVNTNSYELEELQSNTSYVVYLRSVCQMEIPLAVGQISHL